MSQNTALLVEVNESRREVKDLKRQLGTERPATAGSSSRPRETKVRQFYISAGDEFLIMFPLLFLCNYFRC